MHEGGCRAARSVAVRSPCPPSTFAPVLALPVWHGSDDPGKSCLSVPRRPVEGHGSGSTSTSVSEEEERLQRRRERGGGSSSGDRERLKHGGVAVGDKGKGKESPQET